VVCLCGIEWGILYHSIVGSSSQSIFGSHRSQSHHSSAPAKGWSVSFSTYKRSGSEHQREKEAGRQVSSTSNFLSFQLERERERKKN
jgi:hypothetical protein